LLLAWITIACKQVDQYLLEVDQNTSVYIAALALCPYPAPVNQQVVDF
jgi:hypothetical protein